MGKFFFSGVLVVMLAWLRRAPRLARLIAESVKSSPAATQALSSLGMFSSTVSIYQGTAPTFDEFASKSAQRRLPGVTVVIPVHNAASALAANLEALSSNLPEWARVLIIDDASTQMEVGEVLSRFASRPRWTVHKNKENLGYTKSVNRGISEADETDDIVLLNSDAITQGNWLGKLRYVAHSRGSIGTVTPVSDNSGAFSFPDAHIKNQPPTWLSQPDYAKAIEQSGVGEPLEVPTGNGFCFYIRRELLTAIGRFDEIGFPRGYGEENDFSMRASRNGWLNVLSDKVHVAHVGSQSFGPNKDALIDSGLKVLSDRYPNYNLLVGRFHDNEMSEVRNRARRRIEDSSPVMPRVLIVQPIVGGGLPATSEDLAQGLVGSWEVFKVGFHSPGKLALYALERGEWNVVDYPTTNFVSPLKLADHNFDSWFVRVLHEFSIDVVHIEHLQWASLGLPRIARDFGAPVTFSIHDYFSICPNTQLLDANGTFCGGVCTKDEGRDCKTTIGEITQIPKLKGAYVGIWQSEFKHALTFVDMFISPSKSALSRMSRVYPETQARARVIAHGKSTIFFVPPKRDFESTGRVLLLGAIGPHKGAVAIASVLENLKEKGLEVSLLGYASEPLAGMIESFGEYSPEDLEEFTRSHDFDAVLILSIWEETFAHTLTESWMMGLPSICFNVGAQSERTKVSGNGFEIPLDLASKPSELADEISRILSDSDELRRVRDNVRRWQKSSPIQTVSGMAEEYSKIWLNLLGKF